MKECAARYAGKQVMSLTNGGGCRPCHYEKVTSSFRRPRTTKLDESQVSFKAQGTTMPGTMKKMESGAPLVLSGGI